MNKTLFALLVLFSSSLFTTMWAQSPDPCFPYLMHDTVYYCDGDSFFYRGHYYSAPGDYYDSLTTVDGCDSIYHLHLMLYSASYYPAPSRLPQNQIINLCDGQTFWFRGEAITQSGTYTDTLRSSYGCDSIVTFTVNFYPVTYYYITEYVCEENEAVLYRGNYFYPGVYCFFDPNDTTTPCPPIYYLTVLGPPNDTTVFVQDCESNLPIILNDKAYYQSGTYNESLVSINGCDSNVTYVITIDSVQYNTIYDTICRGDSYEFCGFNLSTAGEFTCRTKDVGGCDSIVTTLYLTLLDCDSATAIDDVNLYDITILPNPTSDISYLYADFPDDQLDGLIVEVMTPTGIILNSICPTSFPLAIPAINAPGTYFVRITTSSGAIHIRKLLVH